MTRKDYSLIARSLRDSYPTTDKMYRLYKTSDELAEAVEAAQIGWALGLNQMSRTLGLDNPRFDAARFFSAAMPGGQY